MKISTLLPGIILPFLMFILFGSICTTSEDEDPKICEPTRTSNRKVFRLKDSPVKNAEFKSPNANAECSAYFLVKFGWEDETTQPVKRLSPIEESFGGLKLTFGETSYSNTFHLPQGSIGKENGKNPDGKSGAVWVIKLPVSAPAPSSSGSTKFYVKMEHNILEEDYNIWVDIAIEYSYAQ